jgi:glycosyltransferase involved in cell wall biosynthesis
LATKLPDVVHLHGWGTAQLTSRLGGVPAVHVAIDSWARGLRTQQALPTWRRAIELGELRKVRRHEARHYPRCGAVVVVADADADVLRAEIPDARVEVVPNGVEAGPEPRPSHDPVVGFHGVLSTITNDRAARTLIEDVFPLVQTARPDARLVVAGRDPSPALRSLATPAIEITGAVDDMRGTIERMAVYVAYLTTGTGLKNKVLEAMAAGVPVVATQRALNGIGAGPGVVTAETPSDVADAVVRLLADPRARQDIGRAGRRRMIDRFGWDTSARRIEQLWTELAG